MPLVLINGRLWCNEDYGIPTPKDLQKDVALADFVCRKSGKSLMRVRHIEEVTGH